MKSRQIIKRGAVGTATIGPANLAGISSPAPRSVHSAHKDALKTRKLLSPILACLATAILTAFGSGPLRAAPGSANNPGILPPGSTPGDLSYPDWHVACLNWILSDNNLPGVPAGDYGMMLDDGYYLILAPLSVGAHTIHWAASMTIIPYWNPWDPQPLPPFPQGSPEITYHMTVVPSP